MLTTCCDSCSKRTHDIFFFNLAVMLQSLFLPNAIVAVDPFHVIEHLCRDFENLRISLMKQCPYDLNGYYLLKKWNWLLNKDGIDLDNAKAYNHRFQTALN